LPKSKKKNGKKLFPREIIKKKGNGYFYGKSGKT
jgi:hypothetical protein